MYSLHLKYIQVMNWSNKVDERTKQKIELLYREFDRFIEQNHSTSSAEDVGIVKQWSNFKQLIDKNPTDFQSMHQYLNRLTLEERNQQKIQKKYSEPVRKSNGMVVVDIDKNKLKKLSAEISTLVCKNNKQIFRVL